MPSREIRVISPTKLTPQRWRNGAGYTREVAIDRRGFVAGGFAWRVSVATIAAASQYSAFPGVERWSCVVSENPLELVIDGLPVSSAPGQVISYAGESTVVVRPVRGPADNLNFMVDRRTVTGSMTMTHVDGRLVWSPRVVAALLLAGDAQIEHGSTLSKLDVVLPDGRDVAATTDRATFIEMCATSVRRLA